MNTNNLTSYFLNRYTWWQHRTTSKGTDMQPKRHLLHLLNLPRELCHLAIGKDHKLVHRMAAGGVIMVGGVSVAKAGHFFPPDAILHYGLDVAGYFIHALGAVPYLEWLIEEEQTK